MNALEIAAFTTGPMDDGFIHVTIDVEFNRPAYSFTVASSIAPSASRAVTVAGAVAVVTVPPNVYREKTAASTDDRFCQAETMVLFGAVRAPDVSERSSQVFVVTAAGTSPGNAPPAVHSVVVRLRGNETLIAQILRGSDWTRVLELLK